MRKIIFTMVMAGCMVVGLNAQALKVAADGNVGVGIGTPERALHVQSNSGVFRLDRDANGPGFILAQFSSGFGGAVNSYFVGAAQRSGNNVFEINDLNGGLGGAGTRSLLIDDDGSLIVGSTTVNDATYRLHVEGSAFKNDGLADWNVVSDKRLKKNIQDYNMGLDLVTRLRPVSYEFNGKAGTEDGLKRIGVIAQELQEVAPHMVQEIKFTSNGGFNSVDKSDVAEVTEDHNYLSINTSSLQWALVNSIKEQQEIIEDKEARILDLEDRLLVLEEKITQIVNQTDVNLGGGLSDAGAIGQNVPNPFNGETRIAYSIPEKATSAQMNIFDLNGKLLKSIPIKHTGKGQLNVTADQLPSGTYSYQLVVNNNIVGAKKMILAK